MRLQGPLRPPAKSGARNEAPMWAPCKSYIWTVARFEGQADPVVGVVSLTYSYCSIQLGLVSNKDTISTG
jgi:hypothetical protein